MTSRVLLSVLAALLLAAPLSADTIKLVNGTSIDDVHVLTETYAEVRFRKKNINTPQAVKAPEVLEVVYGSTSPDYREAQDKLAEGSLIDAANAYYFAAKDEANSPHLRATAMIETASILLEARDLDQALPIFDELLQQWPDTRHLARALLGRGKTLLFLGKSADAQAAFAKLMSEAEEKSLGERWQMEGEYYSLRVTETSGDAKNALSGYEELRKRAAAGWPGIANKCLLRVGRVHLSEGNVDKAMPLFEEITDGRLETDNDIVASAFNGLGHCRFAVAQAYIVTADKHAAAGASDRAEIARADAVDSFREARLDFLRVVVSYSHVLEHQAEALYWAAQSFLNVDDTDAQRQAGRLLRKCELEYPSSRWGKLAKQN